VDVLVTGFEPFGAHSKNPSQLVAERLGGAVLPVSATRLGPALDDLIERHQPRLLIGLGLAAGRTTLAVERVGINLIDFPGPDNDGQRPSGEPIVLDGPAAYFATLPLPTIIDRWQARGVPGYVSNTAGTFCCNQALYLSLHERRPGMLAGFIHLPLLPEQAAESPDKQVPTMALDLMLRGVEAAIEAALAPRAPSRLTEPSTPVP
jgi:pyroglutamyl-peptidase